MDTNKNEDHRLFLANILGDDSEEFIPLLTKEDEEGMNKEAVPELLPLLPIRNTVLYPGVVLPITVGREKSIKLVKKAYRGDKTIGVVAQENAKLEEPSVADIYKIGTVAKILKMLVLPDGNTTIIIQGQRRFKIEEIVSTEPFFTAKIEVLEEDFSALEKKEAKALLQTLKDSAQKLLKLNPDIPQEANFALANIESPSFLTHFLASNLNADVIDKQSILEINNGVIRTATGISLTTPATLLLWQDAVIPIDYNNDGKTDLISMDVALNGNHINRSKTFTYSNGAFNEVSENDWSIKDNRELFPNIGDFNGDGKMDLFGMFYSHSTSGINYYKHKIFLSNGLTFTGEAGLVIAGSDLFTPIPQTSVPGFIENNIIKLGDFNGDGKTDILHISKNATGGTYNFNYLITNYCQNGKVSLVQTTFTEVVSGLIRANNCFLADMNSDGKVEACYISTSGVVKCLYYDAGGNPLQIQHITDGMGNKTEYGYAPLNSTNYTQALTESYPTMPLRGGMMVATSLKVPDGTGGISETNYAYANGRILLNGKGFIGFDKVTAKNATNDTWIENESTTSVPGASFDMMVDKITQKTYAGTTVSLTDYNYAFTTVTGSTRFSYLASATATNYLTGAATKSTNKYFDSPYNNELKQSLTEYYNGTTKEGSNQTDYTYQTVGTLRRGIDVVSQQSQIGTAAAFTKQTKYEYNATNLRLSKTTDFFGKPKAVTTSVETWDTYGNPTKLKTSASGVADRLAYTTYSPSGRFVSKTTDAAGLISTYVWNEDKGQLSSEIAPNGLATQYPVYDGQGRLLSTTDPLGITSTMQYAWAIDGTQAFKVTSSSPGSPSPSASSSTKRSKIMSRTLCGRAFSRSILLMTTMGLAPFSSALRRTNLVCACGPSCASTTRSTPSIIFMMRSTSPPKSAWPGVSTMFTW